MTRFVAFLRAINVGGHTVKMDELRRLFEAMGFSNVETYIASGNVIFESPAEKRRNLEHTIEEKLREALGYGVATFLRTLPEVTEVAYYKPFPDSELDAGATLYIAFVRDKLSSELGDKLMALKSAVDDFHINNREIFWLYRRQLGESAISGALVERSLKIQMTVRNSNTVRKIAAKYG